MIKNYNDFICFKFRTQFKLICCRFLLSKQSSFLCLDSSLEDSRLLNILLSCLTLESFGTPRNLICFMEPLTGIGFSIGTQPGAYTMSKLTMLSHWFETNTVGESPTVTVHNAHIVNSHSNLIEIAIWCCLSDGLNVKHFVASVSRLPARQCRFKHLIIDDSI